MGIRVNIASHMHVRMYIFRKNISLYLHSTVKVLLHGVPSALLDAEFFQLEHRLQYITYTIWYKILYKLGSPSPLQNLILRHIYKKVFQFFSAFRPRFPSKFVKSANMTTLQQCNMGIKNVEFDTDFESVEKVAKKLSTKSDKN